MKTKDKKTICKESFVLYRHFNDQQGRKLTDMLGGGVLGVKYPTDKGQLTFCVKANMLTNICNYNFENRLSDIFWCENSSQISNSLVKFLSVLELED